VRSNASVCWQPGNEPTILDYRVNAALRQDILPSNDPNFDAVRQIRSDFGKECQSQLSNSLMTHCIKIDLELLDICHARCYNTFDAARHKQK
jgi:hypothetical protein